MSHVTILFATDTHGSAHFCDVMREVHAAHRPDALVHTGDFSSFGEHHESLFETARELALPVLFVSGNHETYGLCRRLAGDKGATYFDYGTASLGNVQFVGIGACDIFHAEREKNLTEFTAEPFTPPAGAFTVLVTHEPPHPWAWGGKIVGSPIIGRYVESSPFDLVVTGHFHERQLRQERVASTPVIIPMDTGCLVRITTAGKSFEVLHPNED